MRRFERIYDVVEPVEEYRRRGYHPVHLGDVFNERYKVDGKIAFGQFSTVWLATDQGTQRQVALKILKANASKHNRELSTLLRLSRRDLGHPGKVHVLELLDHFEHHGPNGTHLCLVLPVMISDGAGMTVTMTSHSADYVRAISKQILFGLDFLHRLGIIHCDLQPANIMFSLAGVNEIDLDPPEFSPVRWLEGVQADDSAPEYLIPSQRRRGQLDGADPHTLFVKIGDLGGAVWSPQHDQWPVTPRALRPPELICRNTWDANIDIWTLGCTIFELATNEPLFPIGTFGLSAEQIDREHSRLIEQIFGNDGQTNERFTKHLEDRLPPDFGIKNIQRLSWLLLSMLQISPEKRMSAAQLLDHIFLEGVPKS